MDFFEFLQKSSNSPNNSTENKQSDKNKQSNKNKVQKENKQQQENEQLCNQENTVYKNIKRGDFIKIIYLENSNLNSYKGYIGEIRDYRNDQESAVIFLHGISSNNAIKFPIQHFIKID
jgi:hypothetical protein